MLAEIRHHVATDGFVLLAPALLPKSVVRRRPSIT